MPENNSFQYYEYYHQPLHHFRLTNDLLTFSWIGHIKDHL